MVIESLPSTNDILYYIIMQFVGYFGPGYLLLQRQLNSLPFFIKVPLYLSVGMLVVTILLSIIGIFYFWEHTLIIVGAISYTLIFIRVNLSKTRITIDNLVAIIRSQLCLSSIFSIVIFSLTVGIFVYISGYLQWTQPGDAIVHGFLTNLLVKNQALQTTLAPVAPSLLWSAPFGFHVIAANISLIFDIFAGASIFVTATTVMILILLLIYTLTYVLTRSVIFSLLALMSGLYVSSISNLEYWLVGYYYNGPFPCLFGYLTVLVYLIIQFAERYTNHMNSSTYWSVSLISLAGAVIIYPPLAILPTIHFVLTNIVRNRYRFRITIHSSADGPQQDRVYLQNSALRSTIFDRVKNMFNKRGLTTYALLVVAAFAIILVSGYLLSAFGNSNLNNFLSEISYSISQMLLRVGQVSHQYALTVEEFFMSDLDALITFLTIIATLISIVKGKYVYLGFTYLLFSIVLLLSTWNATANYFWFILPRRLFVFLIIFNWVVILTYSRIFMNYLIQKIQRQATTIPSNKHTIKHILATYGIYALIAAPPTILLLPDVISNLQMVEADRWVGWFSRSDAFRNDFDMMAWISENIDSNDLIMVQNSHTSSFFYSLSIRNVTSLPLGIPESEYKIQMAFDNQLTWDRPQILEQFIDRYDVKYVLLLTAPGTWGYKNPVIIGGDRLLHNQKYSVRSYENIFTNMSSLEPVKTFGNSNLYRVLPYA